MASRRYNLVFYILAISVFTTPILAPTKTTPFFVTSIQNQIGVTLTVNKLTPNNKEFVKKKKIYKHYQPLEIVIVNNSKDSFSLKKENLDLKLENPRIIYRRITKKRLFSLIAGLVLAVPSIIFVSASVISFSLFFNSANKDLFLLGFSTLFLAASIPLAISAGMFIKRHNTSSLKNRRFKKELQAKTTNLDVPIIIKPNSYIRKIIYVKLKNYKSIFNIKLTSANNSKIIDFSINLN